jgi:hypothetical protein
VYLGERLISSDGNGFMVTQYKVRLKNSPQAVIDEVQVYESSRIGVSTIRLKEDSPVIANDKDSDTQYFDTEQQALDALIAVSTRWNREAQINTRNAKIFEGKMNSLFSRVRGPSKIKLEKLQFRIRAEEKLLATPTPAPVNTDDSLTEHSREAVPVTPPKSKSSKKNKPFSGKPTLVSKPFSPEPSSSDLSSDVGPPVNENTE